MSLNILGWNIKFIPDKLLFPFAITLNLINFFLLTMYFIFNINYYESLRVLFFNLESEMLILSSVLIGIVFLMIPFTIIIGMILAVWFTKLD